MDEVGEILPGKFFIAAAEPAGPAAREDRMAAMARSGAVAIELLYHPHRPGADELEPVGDARKPSTPACRLRGRDPAADAIAQAASTFMQVVLAAQADG